MQQDELDYERDLQNFLSKNLSFMRQDDIKDLDVPIQKRGNGGYIKLSLWFRENRSSGFWAMTVITTRTVPLVSVMVSGSGT